MRAVAVHRGSNMAYGGIWLGLYQLGKESKKVVNDGIGGFIVGGAIRMDIAGTVSGIFFPVTHACEQAGWWLLKHIQHRDLCQRRKLGLYGGGGSPP
ncbi:MULTISPECIES: hypothetical protein [Acidithiobacillus]|uniref:Uncharacterized protein n=2 Tax=Acidithiobacillus ferriphilus TaxID=1689834 RepID=A0ABU6FRJ5_9PROT|nr:MULTISPECIES: hypothetical protein [Acidithiobacillus]MDA8181268.1 hypothetical protein [Acidithiobacillus sp.]MEB8487265.1 hypothetical protein [Acidithiobacillus ferriphilus]MEB8488934.1 hypothetical protein [Acidithiobacillus ferriphilus]MEB8514681.1 hypothetical protein [Acidithiobacillus ferriphilus]MEB8520734.1 hypothetical protein [Acidithiobacillus ferriphilus]